MGAVVVSGRMGGAACGFSTANKYHKMCSGRLVCLACQSILHIRHVCRVSKTYLAGVKGAKGRQLLLCSCCPLTNNFADAFGPKNRNSQLSDIVSLLSFFCCHFVLYFFFLIYLKGTQCGRTLLLTAIETHVVYIFVQLLRPENCSGQQTRH